MPISLSQCPHLGIRDSGFGVRDSEQDRDRELVFEEALTPRELEVLELLAQGLPNKGIAERLAISDQTVKFHIASIMGKLGASNRVETVRRAVRRGLLSL
jgi:DNA-binding NarL/FixJ family response regulator